MPSGKTATKKERSEKFGLWLVGASGAVGSTVALGLAALRLRRASTSGLVTALPVFQSVDLVAPDAIMVGGHEIRDESIFSAVRGMHDRSGLFDVELINACKAPLAQVQRNIRPGTIYGAGAALREWADLPGVANDRSAAEGVERLAADMDDFRRRHRLRHVVVVNIASTEPPLRAEPRVSTRAIVPADLNKLRNRLARRGAKILPTSCLYALAAIEAECAYINFTPSTGINVPAIRERAAKAGVSYMGRDGKTGESLVKAALAPMFAVRNLPVLSWFGQNLLGNRDGEVLRDPRMRAAKIATKDKIVSGIVGRKSVTRVGIDYVPSLDDWKVAWDFVHFEGFLGTRMNMQFTWQGSDSILAAPLVIDLTRLAALECRRGRSGAMTHLAFFFKDPMDVSEHNLFAQWQNLVAHVTGK